MFGHSVTVMGGQQGGEKGWTLEEKVWETPQWTDEEHNWMDSLLWLLPRCPLWSQRKSPRTSVPSQYGIPAMGIEHCSAGEEVQFYEKKKKKAKSKQNFLTLGELCKRWSLKYKLISFGTNPIPPWVYALGGRSGGDHSGKSWGAFLSKTGPLLSLQTEV